MASRGARGAAQSAKTRRAPCVCSKQVNSPWKGPRPHAIFLLPQRRPLRAFRLGVQPILHVQGNFYESSISKPSESKCRHQLYRKQPVGPGTALADRGRFCHGCCVRTVTPLADGSVGAAISTTCSRGRAASHRGSVHVHCRERPCVQWCAGARAGGGHAWPERTHLVGSAA